VNQRISAIAVGGFVLGATALALIGVMILWGGQLFTHTHKYVLYFRANVNGLREGAPVKFKGVQVGTVDQVRLNMSTRAAGQPPVVTIPVIVALSSNAVLREEAGFVDLENPVVVKELVAGGLRGQLATESILTGILYISLDMQPHTPLKLMEPPQSRYPEIPTVPTPLEQAQVLAMRVLAKLDQIDLDKLLNSLTITITRAGEIVGSPQLKAAVDALPGTITKLGNAADSIQQLANHADREVASTTGALRATSASATQALEQTQVTLKTLRETVGPGSPLNYQLGQTLTDVSQAARALRELADYLDRNPSAIVRGRPVSAGQ
jgi:paraquat-inducible protein B